MPTPIATNKRGHKSINWVHKAKADLRERWIQNKDSPIELEKQEAFYKHLIPKTQTASVSLDK